MNRQVSQLAKQIGKAAVDDDTDSSTHSGSVADDPTDKKGASNRTNVSLVRQKRVSIQE